MQRKNNLLKSSKNGIAMIMAISTIVIISTIMALSLMMSAKTTKSITDLYLYEQAQLYAKSATEYALLKIAQSSPCTYLDENFPVDENLSKNIFDINISVSYIYYKGNGEDPEHGICSANLDRLYMTVTTPEQNGSALIDVHVSSSVNGDKIVYFRRTLQKL